MKRDAKRFLTFCIDLFIGWYMIEYGEEILDRIEKEIAFETMIKEFRMPDI